MKNKLTNNLPDFIKTGLCIVALLITSAIIADVATEGSLNAILEHQAVFSSSSVFMEKELPIYCVKTDKKQVALTFDGAWGNGRYGTHEKRGEFSLTLW